MKKLKTTLVGMAATATLLLATAVPAQAWAQYGGIPPQKSWICANFGICKTMTYCDTNGYKGHLFPRCYKWRY